MAGRIDSTATLFAALAALVAACGTALCAVAQDYPARPVRLIVPFPPGGGTDFFGRIVAQKLTENLGATFIVDNRSGAGGIVGTEIAAKSKADGYVILLVSTSHAINPSLHRKLPFDPMRDFAPVMFPSIATALPFVKSGKVRSLAVTSATRSRIAPELPTISEAGVPGYELSSWYGLLAPAGTPAAIVGRLQQEIGKAFKAADLREKLLAQGVEPLANAPDQFASALAVEIAKWQKVARAAGIPQQ